MKGQKNKGRLAVTTVALLIVGITAFAIGSCVFRNTFGEVFREHSSRDHRKLHRYAMEVEPVRLAIETYIATHGHTPPDSAPQY